MSSDSQIERVNDVVIIGAGFSGLTMACQLQRKLNHFDYSATRNVLLCLGQTELVFKP